MSCFHTLVLKESPLAVGVNTQKSPLDVTVCTALGYLHCFGLFALLFGLFLHCSCIPRSKLHLVPGPLQTEAPILGKGYPDNLGMQSTGISFCLSRTTGQSDLLSLCLAEA